jgi:hypothetical protein
MTRFNPALLRLAIALAIFVVLGAAAAGNAPAMLA